MPDRAAIITGASRGIGYALAEVLGEEGFALTVTARKPEGIERAASQLREKGYEVEDLGPADAQSTDYADYAHPLAKRVSEGTAERGVLLCGTGLGMSYTANR